MYEKGDLKVSLDGNPPGVYDSALPFNGQSLPIHAYLPHSCEEWVIGGVAEIKALIEDLTAALEALNERS